MAIVGLVVGVIGALFFAWKLWRASTSQQPVLCRHDVQYMADLYVIQGCIFFLFGACVGFSVWMGKLAF